VVLLTRQDPDESQNNADVADQVSEAKSLATASPPRAQAIPKPTVDPAPPLTAGQGEADGVATSTETTRKTPKTSTKSSDKGTRGPVESSSTGRKTKRARESLY
jgi:hypothetical protein